MPCHGGRQFSNQRQRRHFKDGHRTMPSSGIEHATRYDRRQNGPRPMKQAARLSRPSLRKLALKFAGRTKAIWVDQRGVAAVEFGLFAIFLSLAFVNVTDTSIYIYQRMQAENATQVAVQAAFKACDLPQLPATINCLGLANAIQKAIQSTSLG